MMSRHDFGQRVRRMLCALTARELLSPDAFAAHVEAATGAKISDSHIRAYRSGDAHFPAELLRHLVDFVGEQHLPLVYAPLLAGTGWELRRVEAAVTASDALDNAVATLVAAIGAAREEAATRSEVDALEERIREAQRALAEAQGRPLQAVPR